MRIRANFRRLGQIAALSALAFGACPAFAADVDGDVQVSKRVVVDRVVRSGALREGIAAFNRKDYVHAAFLLRPLGEAGDPRAQTYLGFMYYYGKGVPQNLEEAARFYGNAAISGVPLSQYQFGLLFDKGQGVPQDYVLAYVWLNRAAAAAVPREREAWERMRNAVGNKLTLAQKTLAQRLAIGSPVVDTSSEALRSFQHLY